MLSDLVASYFEKGVRRRGEQYARSGRVTELHVHENEIVAVLAGGHDYDVWIERVIERGTWRLELECSCPFAEENGSFCKHSWATLLSANAGVKQKWGALPASVTIGFEGPYEEADAEPEIVVPGFESRKGRLIARGPTGTGAIFRLGDDGPDTFIAEHLLRADHSRRSASTRPVALKKPKVPVWKRMLDETFYSSGHVESPAKPAAPIDSPVWFVLDLSKSTLNDAVTVELMREGKSSAAREMKGGVPPNLVRLPITASDIERITNEEDRGLCALLVGAARPAREFIAYDDRLRSKYRASGWQLDPQLLGVSIARLHATGRLLWRASEEHPTRPATWKPTEGWHLALELVPESNGARSRAAIVPVLRRQADVTQRILLAESGFVRAGEPGVVIWKGEIAPLHIPGAADDLLRWARSISRRSASYVDPDEVGLLLDVASKKQLHLPIDWPESWGPKRIADLAMSPRLVLRAPRAMRSGSIALHAEVRFDYGGVQVEPDGGIYISKKLEDGTPALAQRNQPAEHAAIARVLELGGKRDPYNHLLHVMHKDAPVLATRLLDEGWEVTGDAGTYRRPGAVSVRVESGIDWFELTGSVAYGETNIAIGEVLHALRKGERLVKLGDGSVGLLPDQWLEKYGRWIGLGKQEGQGVRFARTQIALVDALLAELPEARCDKQVAAARAKLAAFDRISERAEPAGFRGVLRPYQRAGLGWLHFLAEFGFGGCLADDMGLGKTVQLLAHFADQRALGEKGPWLVVAPKSLLFNWAREAERFAPGTNVLEHAGPERAKSGEALAKHDLILTTYATMRLDIELLRSIQFGCVVLDEAQAIKNGASQAAKCVRLLRARRRLALTGTPVENRLEDLWSIFEFLNPGMLGSVAGFRDAATKKGDRGETEMLKRALRPFLLRRTKTIVAPELPARSEQTVRCELEGKQRTMYDALRNHYRNQLLGRVSRHGMNKSKIHVLEGLLRLRQAACHTHLIEPKVLKNGHPAPAAASDSAKVATLLEMLEEIISEGHKALVFSQFTSLLALVRSELQRKKIGYEELDGSTPSVERAARVERFQSDHTNPATNPVFLISLKAGGVGLNLTAAGYVFLLDPWWNPAVEAQAIDRTHRIGQDKGVIAYRLIASGTVEERMLELQQRKKQLAAAIISEDAGPLASLTREDLEWLLS